MSLYFLLLIGGFWTTVLTLLFSMGRFNRDEKTYERQFTRELVSRGLDKWWERYEKPKKPDTFQ